MTESRTFIVHASLVVVPAWFWAISRSLLARNARLPAGHNPTLGKLKRSIMNTSSHFLHKKVEFQEFFPFKGAENFTFNYFLHLLFLVFICVISVSTYPTLKLFYTEHYVVRQISFGYGRPVSVYGMVRNSLRLPLLGVSISHLPELVRKIASPHCPNILERWGVHKGGIIEMRSVLQLFRPEDLRCQREQ